MIIEQIIFWTGFVAVETALLFCIVFLLWHIGMWIEYHNRWYFYALWVVLFSHWKRKGKEPKNIIYWKNQKYKITEEWKL